MGRDSSTTSPQTVFTDYTNTQIKDSKSLTEITKRKLRSGLNSSQSDKYEPPSCTRTTIEMEHGTDMIPFNPSASSILQPESHHFSFNPNSDDVLLHTELGGDLLLLFPVIVCQAVFSRPQQPEPQD